MAQGTSIIQYLTFQPNTSFDDPATPDGRVWNSALKQVTQTPGWSGLHWGARIASPDVVDLIMTWGRHEELQRFMDHDYQPFLDALGPLLPVESSPRSIQSPYVFELHPGQPSDDLDAVSSIYELSFDPEPSKDVEIGLGIQAQLCRQFFFHAAEQTEDSDSLSLGMDAVWVERYDQNLSNPPESVESGSNTEPRRGEVTVPKILLVITEWTSQDAEKTILSREAFKDESGATTTGEYFANTVLQKASSYTNHHVAFENVPKFNVEWLDKEEKWSTHVRRLMAEADQRQKEEIENNTPERAEWIAFLRENASTSQGVRCIRP